MATPHQSRKLPNEVLRKVLRFSRTNSASSASSGAVGMATCGVVGRGDDAVSNAGVCLPDEPLPRLQDLNQVERRYRLRETDAGDDPPVHPLGLGPVYARFVNVQRFEAKQVSVLRDELGNRGKLWQGSALDLRPLRCEPRQRGFKIREDRLLATVQDDRLRHKDLEVLDRRSMRFRGVLAAQGRVGEHAILDGVRERPERVERARQREDTFHREMFGGRLVADDAVEARRHAHGAAGVGADRERRKARGDNRAGAGR